MEKLVSDEHVLSTGIPVHGCPAARWPPEVSKGRYEGDADEYVEDVVVESEGSSDVRYKMEMMVFVQGPGCLSSWGSPSPFQWTCPLPRVIQVLSWDIFLRLWNPTKTYCVEYPSNTCLNWWSKERC